MEQPVNRNLFVLQPKNDEQAEALGYLYDPKVQLVTLIGMAGTGKTLLAIGTGLQQASWGQYDKVIVSRPIVPMGNDLGHLPGTLEEKLAPWTQPIFDSIEALLKTNPRNLKLGYTPDKFVEDGKLEVEALTYIRGRSIPDQFLIIDEAQNLTHHEVKTIITRAGEGTKIILTGDPAQIDREGLTAENNGLTIVANAFAEQEIAASVTFTECVRSELAALAAKLL